MTRRALLKPLARARCKKDCERPAQPMVILEVNLLTMAKLRSAPSLEHTMKTLWVVLSMSALGITLAISMGFLGTG